MPRNAASGRLLIRDFGYCLNFDGATAYVDVTENANLPIFNTTGMTYAFWVKQPAVMPSNKYYFAEGNSGNINDVFGIANGAPPNDKRISIFIRNHAGANLTLVVNASGDVLKPNQWQHIALTNTNGVVKLYVDGVRVDNGEFNYTPSGSMIFNLCGYGALLRNTVAGFFPCKMDEIIAFKRTLTDTEIQKLYSTGNFYSTSLAFYHKCNEGSGTTVADSSGNSNTGAITAATYSTDTVM